MDVDSRPKPNAPSHPNSAHESGPDPYKKCYVSGRVSTITRDRINERQKENETWSTK